MSYLRDATPHGPTLATSLHLLTWVNAYRRFGRSETLSSFETKLDTHDERHGYNRHASEDAGAPVPTYYQLPNGKYRADYPGEASR